MNTNQDIQNALEIGFAIQTLAEYSEHEKLQFLDNYAECEAAKYSFIQGAIDFEEYIDICEYYGILPDDYLWTIEANLHTMNLL